MHFFPFSIFFFMFASTTLLLVWHLLCFWGIIYFYRIHLGPFLYVFSFPIFPVLLRSLRILCFNIPIYYWGSISFCISPNFLISKEDDQFLFQQSELTVNYVSFFFDWKKEGYRGKICVPPVILNFSPFLLHFSAFSTIKHQTKMVDFSPNKNTENLKSSNIPRNLFFFKK